MVMIPPIVIVPEFYLRLPILKKKRRKKYDRKQNRREKNEKQK